jgi:hypothetical protein
VRFDLRRRNKRSLDLFLIREERIERKRFEIAQREYLIVIREKEEDLNLRIDWIRDLLCERSFDLEEEDKLE